MNYDKPMKAIGDKVVLEIIDKCSEKMIKGIIIPQQYAANMRLSKGKVISLGPDAAKRNLKVGDIVSFDYYSIYYETWPNVITKVENIITMENEENA